MLSIARTTARGDTTVSHDSKSIEFSGKAAFTKGCGEIKERGQPGFEVRQSPREKVRVSEPHIQGRTEVSTQ